MYKSYWPSGTPLNRNTPGTPPLALDLMMPFISLELGLVMLVGVTSLYQLSLHSKLKVTVVVASVLSSSGWVTPCSAGSKLWKSSTIFQNCCATTPAVSLGERPAVAGLLPAPDRQSTS